MTSISEKNNKVACVEWQAHRCAGNWFDTIISSISGIHDSEALGTFLTVDIIGDPVMEAQEPWLVEEVERLNNFTYLLVELASARAWSQIGFTNIMPFPFAAALHETPQVAEQLLRNTQEIWTAILQAERYVDDPEKPKALRDAVKKRLSDLCWNRMQLSREAYVTFAKGNWDPNEKNIKEFTMRLFGGQANTKYDLEDLFAHLVSVSKMSSQATAMGKWFHCTGEKLSDFSPPNSFPLILG